MSLLVTDALDCGYGDIRVVRDLGLRVEAGEVVVLLGPNGAGKTTTLMTIAGAQPALGGIIDLDGARLTGPLHRRARGGIGLLTERRSIFRGLSVRDNVRVAGVAPDAVLALFPELEKRWRVKAGLLSGGEQQMLALGRVLARRPRLLLLDELSLGLAPLVVERLLHAVRAAADTGVGVLLVEQHAKQALESSDRGYVMRRGSIALEGDAADLLGRLDDVRSSYLASSTSAEAVPESMPVAVPADGGGPVR